MGPYIYLNVANLNRQKPLNSRQSTSSAPVLASARTSRTVKYASTCPSLCEATSDAPWRVFPRHIFATLGYIQVTFPRFFLYVYLTTKTWSSGPGQNSMALPVTISNGGFSVQVSVFRTDGDFRFQRSPVPLHFRRDPRQVLTSRFLFPDT
jgi:hypothetical protein